MAASRLDIESTVRNLVIDQTGVPDALVELDSVFGADLAVDQATLDALKRELRHLYELKTLNGNVDRSSTLRDLVNVIMTEQSQPRPVKAQAAAPVAGDDSAPVVRTKTASLATVDNILSELEGDPAAQLYARHINPVMVALGKVGGWLPTFVRGEGTRLFDEDGRPYLDFVAGCGSVNLGHNPPRIVAALRAAIEDSVPGFAQSSINPIAARLAEKLTSLAPAGLDMAFFCNSGAESVEAALKLARAATGRKGYLYCQGSYHGKSLGALSVTGHVPFQTEFEPLIPQCVSVPFGHERVLQRALETEQFAAFIVEPVQGERGTYAPPAGYLRRAQDMCNATGTLLIADEVQTGMGRTGKLFACEHDLLTPDVMTVAKSLGGGMLPIGAMLTRREHWLKAYGTAERCSLHTSTFGGGSLACSVGLAALDALSDPNLLDRVQARGRELLAGLQQIARDFPQAVREARGVGLMLALELQPLDSQLASIVQSALEADERPETHELIGDPKRLVNMLPSTLLIETMLREHGVYTLMARSNPLVLRVQPPLTITSDDVEQFLTAVRAGCELLNDPAAILSQLMAQSAA